MAQALRGKIASGRYWTGCWTRCARVERVLVLQGEAGVGKTVLLDYVQSARLTVRLSERRC